MRTRFFASLVMFACAVLLGGCVTVGPLRSGSLSSASLEPIPDTQPQRTPRPCREGDTRPRCQTAAPDTPTPPSESPSASPSESPTASPSASPTESPTATPTMVLATPSIEIGVDTDLAISATVIDFGQVNVGSTGQASVTLTNTGGDPFGPINMFGGAPPTGEFNASQNCQGTTLPAGGSCMVSYEFSPLSTGQFSDYSAFTVSETASQADGENFQVNLYGVGYDPNAT